MSTPGDSPGRKTVHGNSGYDLWSPADTPQSDSPQPKYTVLDGVAYRSDSLPYAGPRDTAAAESDNGEISTLSKTERSARAAYVFAFVIATAAVVATHVSSGHNKAPEPNPDFPSHHAHHNQ